MKKQILILTLSALPLFANAAPSDEKHGHRAPPSVEQIFEKIDANADGSITKDEWNATKDQREDRKEKQGKRKGKKDGDFVPPGRPGTEEFVPGHLGLPLSRDKGTAGQGKCPCPGTKGQRDVPSRFVPGRPAGRPVPWKP